LLGVIVASAQTRSVRLRTSQVGVLPREREIKDSLAVVWRGVADLELPASTIISGYKVRYQAVGSSVVQYSQLQVRRQLHSYSSTYM